MLTKQFREFERWADEQDKAKAQKKEKESISRREFLKKLKDNPSLLFTKIKKQSYGKFRIIKTTNLFYCRR